MLAVIACGQAERIYPVGNAFAHANVCIWFGGIIASIVEDKVSYHRTGGFSVKDENGVDAGVRNGEVAICDGVDA